MTPENSGKTLGEMLMERIHASSRTRPAQTTRSCCACMIEFAEDFLAVVKDATGLSKVTDDESGAEATFSRINDLRESYQAAVLAASDTTPDGKSAPGKVPPAKVEYWDYRGDAEVGGGKTAKEFVFVEMNSGTGLFQIGRGREFFS